VGFFGSAYAARCLGPVNLGIASLIQSIVQALVLLNAAGMDLTLVRHVAADESLARPLMFRVLRFRLKVMVLLLLPLWISYTAFFTSPVYRPAAWTGIGLLALSAFANNPVYQALQRLPVLSVINLIGTTLTTLGYFLFFHPGMSAGANLIVLTAAGLATAVLSWWQFFRISSRPGKKMEVPPSLVLLRESLPYWAQGIVAYFYSSFQIPLIALLLSQRQLGVYRTSLMLTAAAEMFYSSINSLLLPKLVRWRQQGVEHLWSKQKELLVLSTLSGGFASLILILIAPIVYRKFLGPEFSEGVRPFQILVLARFIVFVGQIYSWGLTALRLDRQFLASTVIGAIFSVVASLLVIPRAGLIGAALVSMLTELAVHLFCFWHVRSKMLSHRAVQPA
jgi:O-antigen/teichoic acid export membrane protein